MVITKKMIRILLIGFMCAVLVLGVPVYAGEQKISPDGGLHMTPRIDGNRVVWADTDNQAIYLFEICSGGPANKISSPDAKDPYGPEISENKVVWGDYRFNDVQLGNALVLYDISAGMEIPIEHQPHPEEVNPAWEYFSQNNPSLSGNYVVYWITNPWNNDNREIYYHVLGSGNFRLVSTYNDYGGETNEHPKISGDKIVWADYLNDQYSIWLCDRFGIGPKKQISTSSNNAKNPDIDGNLVVWQEEHPDGNADIMLYDITNGGTPTPITNDPAVNHRNPAISGDRIVWQEDSNYQTSGWDIYRYNIKKKTTDRITTDPYDQIYPDVSKNYIVWEDQRDGLNIYLYTDGSPDTLLDQFSCWLRVPDVSSQIRTWFSHGWITLATPSATPAPTPTIISKGHLGAPTASFTATPSSGKAPLKVTLDASGSQAGSSPIASYAWDFGDGMSGTGVTGSHTYTSAGTYTVRLLIKDSAGQTDSYYRKVTVSGTQTSKNAEEASPVTYGPVVTPAKKVKLQPPEFTFRPDPSTGYVPFTVTCRANVISSIGPIVSYKWDFGDGQTGSGQTVAHTYMAPGLYKIYITVTDSYGSSAYTKAEVLALSPTTAPTATPTSHANQPPAAAFTLTPSSGSAPLTVKFDASGSNDPDGSIASYAWDFGDGQAGSGKAPSHVYGKDGSYTVKLTVTDDRGATGESTRQVMVTVIMKIQT